MKSKFHLNILLSMFLILSTGTFVKASEEGKEEGTSSTTTSVSVQTKDLAQNLKDQNVDELKYTRSEKAILNSDKIKQAIEKFLKGLARQDLDTSVIGVSYIKRFLPGHFDSEIPLNYCKIFLSLGNGESLGGAVLKNETCRAIEETESIIRYIVWMGKDNEYVVYYHLFPHLACALESLREEALTRTIDELIKTGAITPAVQQVLRGGDYEEEVEARSFSKSTNLVKRAQERSENEIGALKRKINDHFNPKRNTGQRLKKGKATENKSKEIFGTAVDLVFVTQKTKVSDAPLQKSLTKEEEKEVQKQMEELGLAKKRAGQTSQARTSKNKSKKQRQKAKRQEQKKLEEPQKTAVLPSDPSPPVLPPEVLKTDEKKDKGKEKIEEDKDSEKSQTLKPKSKATDKLKRIFKWKSKKPEEGSSSKPASFPVLNRSSSLANLRDHPRPYAQAATEESAQMTPKREVTKTSLIPMSILENAKEDAAIDSKNDIKTLKEEVQKLRRTQSEIFERTQKLTEENQVLADKNKEVTEESCQSFQIELSARGAVNSYYESWQTAKSQYKEARLKIQDLKEKLAASQKEQNDLRRRRNALKASLHKKKKN